MPFLIPGIIIALFFGFIWGAGWGINECIEAGQKFVDITVDEKLIKEYIYNYKNLIPIK